MAKTFSVTLVFCMLMSLMPLSVGASSVDDKPETDAITVSGDVASMFLIDYLADVGIIVTGQDKITLMSTYETSNDVRSFSTVEDSIRILQVMQQREDEIIVSVVTCLDISEENAGFVDVPFITPFDTKAEDYKPSGTNVKLVGVATYDTVYFDLFQGIWARPKNAHISYSWDGGSNAVDWIAVGLTSDGELCDNNRNVLQTWYSHQIKNVIDNPRMNTSYGSPGQALSDNQCIWLNTNTFGGAMQLGLEAKIEGKEYSRGFKII